MCNQAVCDGIPLDGFPYTDRLLAPGSILSHHHSRCGPRLKGLARECVSRESDLPNISGATRLARIACLLVSPCPARSLVANDRSLVKVLDKLQPGGVEGDRYAKLDR